MGEAAEKESAAFAVIFQRAWREHSFSSSLAEKSSLSAGTAPGHTPGSMAYLLDDRILFSGDALRIGRGKAEIHPFTEDRKKARSSIDELLRIGRAKEILSSHYGMIPAAKLPQE